MATTELQGSGQLARHVVQGFSLVESYQAAAITSRLEVNVLSLASAQTGSLLPTSNEQCLVITQQHVFMGCNNYEM